MMNEQKTSKTSKNENLIFIINILLNNNDYPLKFTHFLHN